jgi:hypothetical protein
LKGGGTGCCCVVLALQRACGARGCPAGKQSGDRGTGLTPVLRIRTAS